MKRTKVPGFGERIRKDLNGEFVTERDLNYFDPPHGGRPPSDEAVHAATQRYVDKKEKQKT